MKNVMVRAWEIAKEGASKFGGNVKEYFAQALAMAWAEAKKPKEHFGFTKIKNVNGIVYFAVDDIPGLEVTYLGWKFNLKGEKVDVHRPLDYRTGTEKATGRKVRLYQISSSNVVAFRHNGVTEKLDMTYNKFAWTA